MKDLRNHITVSAVANRGDVSGAAVRKWERSGQLPAVRIANGTRLFDPEDVDRFLQARAQRAQPQGTSNGR